MKTFVLETWEDTLSLVTYYTVRWDDEETSETDKFIEQFKSDDAIKENFNEIIALIVDIGDRRGAKKNYFNRFADEASELPPNQNIEIGGIEINYHSNVLRLFCTRINDNIVILFNGGVKSSQATQDSPDLATKFREAKYFAKKIWENIRDEMIQVDEVRHALLNFDGSDELIIY